MSSTIENYRNSASSYVIGIDGLRAIAILSVVIYHFDKTILPGGFTGVDIFFVISGYVISKSLCGNYQAKFSTFILNFYKRRILRIFPALVFMLIVTSVVSTLFVPISWLSMPNESTSLAAFFGVSNFFLVRSADGYFANRIPFNPFVHTWSLAVEEQFYLFFPLIFYFWLRNHNGGNRFGVIFLLFPAITLSSLVLASYETTFALERAFYLLPSRFWELAAGALLFQLNHLGRLTYFRKSIQPKWLSLAGITLLAIGFFRSDEQHFPFPYALFPVIGTVLLIIWTTDPAVPRQGVQACIQSRIMTYIGRISYSLYLWHWPVFVLFRWTVGLASLISTCAALALTFGLSVLSYHSLENTFRYSALLKRQPSWRIVTMGVGSIAFFFLATMLLFKYDAPLGLNLSVTARSDWNAPAGVIKGANMLLGSDAYKLLGRGRKIFVIGDSHAGAYNRMLNQAAAILGAQVKVISRAGCPIAKLIVASKDSQACRAFEENVISQLEREADPGDIVFLASLRVHRFGDQFTLFDQRRVLSRSSKSSDIEEKKVALEQAGELIARFKGLGLHVLFDAPKPIFKAPLFRCSDWFNKINPICTPGFSVDRELLLKHREPAMLSLMALKKSHFIHVWDPFPILCSEPVCSAIDETNGNPLFIDGDHLSGYGNQLLVPSFVNQLLAIWGESETDGTLSGATRAEGGKKGSGTGRAESPAGAWGGSCQP